MTRGIRRGDLGRAVTCLVALVALAAGTAGRGGPPQDVEKSPPASHGLPPAEIHDLFPAETITFPAAAPLMLLNETKCDLKGNIYIVQSASPPSLLGQFNGLSAIPVSKLSIDSKSTSAYRVPSLDGYRGVVRFDFDVGGDGQLYALLEALDSSDMKNQEPSFFVAKYDDDGSVDSYFKLGKAPEGRMQPFRLAMFRDGNVLVTGTLVSGGPLRPFIAVLDRAGTFVTYVKVSDDIRDAKKPAVGSRNRGPRGEDQTASAKGRDSEASESESDLAVNLSSSSLMVSAPDDNIYLLRGTTRPQVHVISSAGEVIREFEVPTPARGLTATNMGMAGSDRIFISFGHVQGASKGGSDSSDPSNLISLINPQTGEVSATYRLKDDTAAFDVPGCAASYYNFLFVGTTADHQHLQATRYLLH